MIPQKVKKFTEFVCRLSCAFEAFMTVFEVHAKNDRRHAIYMNCQFLQLTSNLIEQFFCMTGYTSSDYRQRITPEHLEEQLFLKANAQFWNIDTVVDVLNK